MCNSESLSAKKHLHSRSELHCCVFKILQCSSHQLCIFCFLLYYIAVGNHAHAINVTYPTQTTTELEQERATVYVTHSSQTTTESKQERAVQCFEDACYIKISSSREALENMEAVSEHLFDAYAIEYGSQKLVNEHGVEQFINDVGLVSDDHEGHEHHEDEDDDNEHHEDEDDDNEHHEDEDDEESQNHESATKSRKRCSDDDAEFPCYPSVKELLHAYFPRQSEDIRLTLGDFMALMPRLLLDLKRPEFRYEEESEEDHDDEDHDDEAANDGTGIDHSTTNIWLISFGSVFVISLVSLLGVMVIPLLRHSKIFDNVIAFLVALAVGALIGDALLHLLPHASGDHDDHDVHDEHEPDAEPDDHFDSMWKGLVACAGIYVFFLLEAGMGFVRRKKTARKIHMHAHSSGARSPIPSSSSPSIQAVKITQDGTVLRSSSDSPLPRVLEPNHNGNAVPVPNGGETVLRSSSDSPLPRVPESNQNGNAVPVPSGDARNCTHHLPVVAEFNGVVCNHDDARRESTDERHVVQMDEEPLETGHHHHHAHEVPQTIASLAWMVIVGDGLHNVTDGLAIGAAFTSGIGAGLSTVLAIFFHEIPQELGDFAILLNAGMTVKQALLWNFLSACLCFVGLLIGLLVGEYANEAILWILAFTAGGFLYIALVDMLPTMIRQLGEKEHMQRFVLQNIGILVGIALMVLIALREESFATIFS